MSGEVTLALVEAGAASLVIGSAVVWAARREREVRHWRELRFPAEVSAGQVEAVLRRVAVLRSGSVALVIDATLDAIRFFLGAPASTLAAVEASVVGLLPEAGIEEAAPPDVTFRVAGVLSLRGRWPLLRSDAPETTVAGLLGSLASVGVGEQVRLVVRLRPVGRVRLPRETARPKTAGAAQILVGLVSEASHQPATREASAVRAKYAQPVLGVSVVALAQTTSVGRGRQLLARVLGALRVATGTRGRFRLRLVDRPSVAARLADLARPLRVGMVLSPAEAVAFSGWPVGRPQVRGLRTGAPPRLIAPSSLSSGEGRVLALSDHPATKGRPLAHALTSSLAIIGPTGSGKSTVILNDFARAVRAGHGALLIDAAKSDLVEDALALIPPERHADVLVIDPTDPDQPLPGIPLFAPGVPAEVSADVLSGIIRSLFPDTFGVRTQSAVRIGLHLLANVPGASLLDLPRILTDPRVMEEAAAQSDDLHLQASVARFLALGERERLAQLQSPMSKLEELLARRSTRVLVGQQHSRLVWSEVLARQRIVLCKLPPSLLGDTGARLAASLILWGVFAAIEARSALPPAKRHPFTVVVDEVAALTDTVRLPFEELLARARSAGASLLLSPQSLGQLDPSVRAALLANAGGLLVHRLLSAEEATAVAKQLPGVSSEQLQALERFHVVARTADPVTGEITAPMTGVTLPPPEPVSDPEQVRRVAARWGQTITQVDQAFAERIGLDQAPPTSPLAGPDEPPGSVGTKRRDA